MRTVEATFQHEADAKAARSSLLADGIEAQRISLLDRNGARRMPAAGAAKGRGLWANIKDIVAVPEEPRADADAGLTQGGWLLTVSVAEEKLEGVVALLSKTGTVEFDAAGGDEAADGGSEIRVPVVEERLAVDKRSTDGGGVRLSSHVAERPVHDRVRLYDYRVRIERRAVDRATGAGGLDALEDLFRERTVEMTETRDEVSFVKEARVREEVIVRKEVSERVEEIDTTLRRTQVEVEGLPPDRDRMRG